MINAIIGAISTALYKEFGDWYRIHMEEVSQDLEEPCFFIQALEPAGRLLRGPRYTRTNQFCIQYFPESEKEPNRECYDTAERMFSCLEQIALEGSWRRGTRRRYKVVDGRLNFFINFDCILRREGEEQSMGEMTSRTEVKEGG